MKTMLYAAVLLSLLAGMLFSPLSTSTVAAAACGDTYTVVRGDYLTKIAKSCGVTYDSLLKANPEVTNPNRVFPGQVIRIKAGSGIPATGGVDYVVVKGDTLFKIAVRYGVTTADMLALNPAIKDASRIFTGQVIHVPASSSTSTSNGSLQVTLSATSLKPGDKVTVTVKGFPANADIDFRLGVDGKGYSVVLDSTTSAQGTASGQLTLPTSAKAGEKWSVKVLTTSLTNGKEVKSALITIK